MTVLPTDIGAELYEIALIALIASGAIVCFTAITAFLLLSGYYLGEVFGAAVFNAMYLAMNNGQRSTKREARMLGAIATLLFTLGALFMNMAGGSQLGSPGKVSDGPEVSSCVNYLSQLASFGFVFLKAGLEAILVMILLSVAVVVAKVGFASWVSGIHPRRQIQERGQGLFRDNVKSSGGNITP